MNSARSRYRGHRFAPEIIGYAVWVYHRFCLSFRDVEDLLAERGIIVSTKPSIQAVVLEIRIRLRPNVLKRNRDASVIPGIWTNSSSESTAGSSLFGVPWIRTVMSSIFCYSLAAISVQPSGSSADCCAVKASSHSGSSPTLEVAVPRGLANGNGGLMISSSRLQSAQTRSE